MAKKIYVGNLSFDTNDDQLNSIFAPFGAVTSARVIKDKFTDRSRGFGFVEMTSNSEAAKAIQSLNGFQMGGRALKVNEAQAKTDRPRRAY